MRQHLKKKKLAKNFCAHSNSHTMKLERTRTDIHGYDLLIVNIKKTASSTGGQVVLSTVVVCSFIVCFVLWICSCRSNSVQPFSCLFFPSAHFQVSPSGSSEERAARLPDWMERLLQDGQPHQHTSSLCSLPSWFMAAWTVFLLTTNLLCVVLSECGASEQRQWLRGLCAAGWSFQAPNESLVSAELGAL